MFYENTLNVQASLRVFTFYDHRGTSLPTKRI